MNYSESEGGREAQGEGRTPSRTLGPQGKQLEEWALAMERRSSPRTRTHNSRGKWIEMPPPSGITKGSLY